MAALQAANGPQHASCRDSIVSSLDNVNTPGMADKRMRDLLKLWNLPQLIKSFEENYITLDVLRILVLENADDFRTLVPSLEMRTVIKDRILEGRLDDLVDNRENVVSTTNSYKIVNDSTLTKLIFENCSDEPEQGTEVVTLTLPVTSAVDADASKLDNLREKSMSDREFCEGAATDEPPKKRAKNFSKEFRLKDILDSDVMGKALVAYFVKDRLFSSRCQGYLCDVIVSYLLNNGLMRVDYEVIEDIADEIVKFFPSEEKAVYYVPPIRKKDSRKQKSIPAKGKLVDKFRNKLTFLRNSTLLPSRNTDSTHDEVDEDNFEENGNTAMSSKTWLIHNRKPWEDVLKHWETSYSIRLKEYSRMDSASILHSTFEAWPILSSSTGYLLIEKDFDKKYPECSDELLMNWNAFFDDVLKLRRSFLPTSDELLVALLEDENVREDCKNWIKFFLLPSLVARSNKIYMNAKGIRKYWKPTTAESREGFVLLIKVYSDLENVIKQRREKLRGMGLTDQPLIILVGASLTAVEKIFVRIDECMYCVPSVLKAVDIAFKSFIVFNAQYPLESENIWYLLQWGIYNLRLKADNTIPNIVDILNRLRAVHNDRMIEH